MPMESVHLLVLVHGMWGNPDHLNSLHEAIKERYRHPDSPRGPGGEQLEVLLAETNRDDHTYDGIDWGGERVAEEIFAAMKRLEDNGKTVTRFSITGYSLGGLIARYAVGILHQKGFFDNVTGVTFNTIATPHIGLPRYRTVLSTVASYLGPTLLSRTGEQFWAVDKWSPRGRPLLEVMADPERVFYQSLYKFQHLRIYANAVNDITVPCPTAAIEADDIFYDHMTNGIDIQLDEQYAPIIKSYRLPETLLPPPIPPKPLSVKWWSNMKPPVPPALQFKFPFNILVYISLPIIFPILITLVLTRLTLSMRASRRRIKLMEKDESSVDRLMHVIGQLERSMEDAVADMLDEPGSPEPTFLPESHAHVAVPAPKRVLLTPSPSPELSAADAEAAKVDGTDFVTAAHPGGRPPTVLMTDLQLRLVRSLNTLPHLKKELAFIHPLRNTHGPIICRDTKRFPSHKAGMGVVNHWADHFII